jgi:hypothetical protein
MTAKIQNLLSDIAKCVRLSLEFPDGAPIRISGYQDADAPFFLISVDQPDSELIFAILQTIGLAPAQSRSPRFPWFLNRPYENEVAGEIAYKTRRTVRQKFNRKWHADLWALCVYPLMGCPNEYRDFVERHPEKIKWMLLAMPFVLFGVLKTRLTRLFSHSH